MPDNKSNDSWMDLNKLSAESDAFVSVDDLKADLSSALEELPNASSVRSQALATTFYTAGDTQNPGYQQIEESLLSLPPSRVSRRYAPIKDGEFNASRPPDPMFINAAARKPDETGDRFLYPQPVARPESLEGLARQKQANEPAVDNVSSAFFTDEADMPLDPRAMAFAKFRGAKVSKERPASFSLSNAVTEGSAEENADPSAQPRTLSSTSAPVLAERIAEPSPQASQVSAPSLEADLPPSVKSVLDKRRKEAESAAKAASKSAPVPQRPRSQEGKANGSPGVDLEDLMGQSKPRGAPQPVKPADQVFPEATESEADLSDVKKNSDAPLDVDQAAESGLFGNSLLEGVDLAAESSLFSSSAEGAASRESAYSAEDVDAFFDMALNQLSQEDDTLGSIEASSSASDPAEATEYLASSTRLTVYDTSDPAYEPESAESASSYAESFVQTTDGAPPAFEPIADGVSVSADDGLLSLDAVSTLRPEAIETPEAPKAVLPTIEADEVLGTLPAANDVSSENSAEEGFSFAEENEETLADGLSSEPEEAVSGLLTDAMEAAPVAVGLETPIATDAAERPVDAPQDAPSAENAASSAPDVLGAELEISAEALDLEGTPLSANFEQSAGESASALMGQAPETFSGGLAQQAAAESSVQIESAVSGDTEGVSFGSIGMADGAAQDTDASGILSADEGISTAQALDEATLSTAPASASVPGIRNEQAEPIATEVGSASADQGQKDSASLGVAADSRSQAVTSEIAEKTPQSDSRAAVFSPDGEPNTDSPNNADSPDSSPQSGRIVSMQDKEDSTRKSDTTQKLGLSEQTGAPDATSGLDAISSTAPQDASSPPGASVASDLALSAPNVESGESAIATSVTPGSATGPALPESERVEGASVDVALSERSLERSSDRPAGGPADRPVVSSADASAPKGADSGSPANPLRNIIASTGRFINRLTGTLRRDSAEPTSASNAANNSANNTDSPPSARGAAAAKTEENAVSVVLGPAPSVETVTPQPLASELAEDPQAIRVSPRQSASDSAGPMRETMVRAELVADEESYRARAEEPEASSESLRQASNAPETSAVSISEQAIRTEALPVDAAAAGRVDIAEPVAFAGADASPLSVAETSRALGAARDTLDSTGQDDGRAADEARGQNPDPAASSKPVGARTGEPRSSEPFTLSDQSTQVIPTAEADQSTDSDRWPVQEESGANLQRTSQETPVARELPPSEGSKTIEAGSDVLAGLPVMQEDEIAVQEARLETATSSSVLLQSALDPTKSPTALEDLDVATASATGSATGSEASLRSEAPSRDEAFLRSEAPSRGEERNDTARGVFPASPEQGATLTETMRATTTAEISSSPLSQEGKPEGTASGGAPTAVDSAAQSLSRPQSSRADRGAENGPNMGPGDAEDGSTSGQTRASFENVLSDASPMAPQEKEQPSSAVLGASESAALTPAAGEVGASEVFARATESGETVDSDLMETSLMTNASVEPLRLVQDQVFEQGPEQAPVSAVSADQVLSSLDRTADATIQADQSAPFSTPPVETTVSETDVVRQAAVPPGSVLSEATLMTSPASPPGTQGSQISSAATTLLDAATATSDAFQKVRGDRALPQETGTQETGNAGAPAQPTIGAADRGRASQDMIASQGVESPGAASVSGSSRPQASGSGQPAFDSDFDSRASLVDVLARPSLESNAEGGAAVTAYGESAVFTETAALSAEGATGNTDEIASTPAAPYIRASETASGATKTDGSDFPQVPEETSVSFANAFDPGKNALESPESAFTAVPVSDALPEAPLSTETAKGNRQPIAVSEDGETRIFASVDATAPEDASGAPIPRNDAGFVFSGDESSPQAASLRVQEARLETITGAAVLPQNTSPLTDPSATLDIRDVATGLGISSQSQTPPRNEERSGAENVVSPAEARQNAEFAETKLVTTAASISSLPLAQEGFSENATAIGASAATNSVASPFTRTQSPRIDTPPQSGPNLRPGDAEDSVDAGQARDSIDKIVLADSAPFTLEDNAQPASSILGASESAAFVSAADGFAASEAFESPLATNASLEPFEATQDQDFGQSIALEGLAAGSADRQADATGQTDRGISSGVTLAEGATFEPNVVLQVVDSVGGVLSEVSLATSPASLPETQSSQISSATTTLRKPAGAASDFSQAPRDDRNPPQEIGNTAQRGVIAPQGTESPGAALAARGPLQQTAKSRQPAFDSDDTSVDFLAAQPAETSAKNESTGIEYGESALLVNTGSMRAETAVALQETFLQTDSSAFPPAFIQASEALEYEEPATASKDQSGLEGRARAAQASDPIAFTKEARSADAPFDQGPSESTRLFYKQAEETGLAAPLSMEITQEQSIVMRLDDLLASGAAASSSPGAKASLTYDPSSEDVTLPIIADPKALGRAEEYTEDAYIPTESFSLADAFQSPSQQAVSFEEISVAGDPGRPSLLDALPYASDSNGSPRLTPGSPTSQKARRQSRSAEQSIRTETVYRLQEETVVEKTSRQASSSQESSKGRAAQAEENIDLASMSMEDRLEIMIRRERVRIQNEYNTKEDNSKIALRRAESRIREGVSRALPPRVEAKENARVPFRSQVAENSYVTPEASQRNNSDSPPRSEERTQQAPRQSANPKEQFVTIRDVEYLREQQQVDEVLLRQQIKRELRLETEERIAKSNVEQEIKMKRKMRSMIDKFLNS